MSAMGHKRTYAVQKGMSALPQKADIAQYSETAVPGLGKGIVAA